MKLPVVIGSGSWGTALSIILAKRFDRVLLFARNQEKAARIERDRESSSLSGIRLSENIFCTGNLADVKAADLIIIATPAQAMRETLIKLKPYFTKDISVIITSKGIEQETHLFMSEVLKQVLPNVEPFLLSGPSFARDVAHDLPTAVTLAGTSLTRAADLSGLLTTKNFRIYPSDDMRGVEFGGSAKNVLAIACGIAEGLHLGDSARAALITRGFAELVRMGVALGAKKDTLFGLSGLGDLLLTGSSRQSRNFSLGLRLAQQDFSDRPEQGISEGAWTCPVLAAMARKLGVDMPVVDAVSNVIAGKYDCLEEVKKLLSRPIKTEH